MENYNYKNHSNFFNKYYCLIENAGDTELYYRGVSDFLRSRFKKNLTKLIRENRSHLLNDNDLKYLQIISKKQIFKKIKFIFLLYSKKFRNKKRGRINHTRIKVAIQCFP